MDTHQRGHIINGDNLPPKDVMRQSSQRSSFFRRCAWDLYTSEGVISAPSQKTFPCLCIIKGITEILCFFACSSEICAGLPVTTAIELACIFPLSQSRFFMHLYQSSMHTSFLIRSLQPSACAVTAMFNLLQFYL